MITKAGAKLLDFGPGEIADDRQPGARRIRTHGDHSGHRRGTILGTLQYMSPNSSRERMLMSERHIQFRRILYEMATGRRAFEGKSQAR